MLRDHCPPSRRGHTWRELPNVSRADPTIRELYELRRCARCTAIGRVDGQGRVVVVASRDVPVLALAVIQELQP